MSSDGLVAWVAGAFLIFSVGLAWIAREPTPDVEVVEPSACVVRP